LTYVGKVKKRIAELTADKDRMAEKRDKELSQLKNITSQREKQISERYDPHIEKKDREIKKMKELLK
jgi:uncharacterized protein (DUF3084 family)